MIYRKDMSTMEYEMIERELDLHLREAVLYAECAAYEYDMMQLTYGDELMCEDGEQAKSSLFTKIKAAIQKIFNSLLGSMDKIRSKAGINGDSVSVDGQVQAIKNIAAKNPEYANRQIEIVDPALLQTNYAYAKNIMKKYKEKIKAGGSLTDEEINILNEAVKKVKNTRRKTVGIVAGAVAIGAACVKVGSCLSKSKIKKLQDENTTLANENNVIKSSDKGQMIVKMAADEAELESYVQNNVAKYISELNKYSRLEDKRVRMNELIDKEKAEGNEHNVRDIKAAFNKARAEQAKNSAAKQ